MSHCRIDVSHHNRIIATSRLGQFREGPLPWGPPGARLVRRLDAAHGRGWYRVLPAPDARHRRRVLPRGRWADPQARQTALDATGYSR